MALFRLGFPSAPHLKCLTLPVKATRRTVLQKVRGRTINVLPQFVNTGFQVLFHSPPGVLFTFPSQYYALSVTKDHKVPRVSWYFGSRSLTSAFVYGALTLSGRISQSVPLAFISLVAVRNPGMHAFRFRLLPFRSPLLWKSMFLSFPPAT